MKKTITQKKKETSLIAGKIKNVLLRSFILLILFTIALTSANAQNSCSNATVFNNDNLDSTLTYSNSGSVYWIRFVASDSNLIFEFSEAGQTPSAGIQYFNLYRGACNSLVQISTDSIKFKVANLFKDSTYYIEIHKSDTNLSYFNLKIYIDTNNYIYKFWTNIDCPPASCDLIMNPGFDPVAGFVYNDSPFYLTSDSGRVCGWLLLDYTPNLTMGTLPGSTAPYVHMWSNWEGGGNVITGEAVQQQITTALVPGVQYQLSFKWRQLAFVGQEQIDELCFYLVNPNAIPNINNPNFYDAVTIGLSNIWGTGLRNIMDNSPGNAIKIEATDPQFFNLLNTTNWTNVIRNFTVPNANFTKLVIFPLRNSLFGASIEIDEVHITYVPIITATSTTSSICQGWCVNLSASGAATYNWTPGNLFGSQVNVCPTTTTTYTVTGTTTDGCTASDTITITVNPIPNVAISADNNSLCQGFNQNSLLTASGALTYLWDNNITTAQLSVSPTVTTTYTVTGTDVNGCTNSASEVINVVQCDCQGTDLTNVTWNSTTTPLTGGQPYHIVSNITVGLPGVIITGNILSFDPGISLTITNGASLTINNCHLYACTNMWEGIKVDPGGQLIINDVNSLGTTLIEDAVKAVAVSSPDINTKLTIDNTIFNRNTDGVYINTYHDNSSNPISNFKITNSVFTSRLVYDCQPPYTGGICTSPWPSVASLQQLTSTGSLKEHYNLDNFPCIGLKPLGLTPAQRGIALNEVGSVSGGNYIEAMIDGDNTNGTINLFDNLLFGIDATNTNLTCKNNAFQYIIGTSNSWADGIGIRAYNVNNATTPFNRLRVIGKTNYFYDCKTGIDAVNYDDVRVQDVDMRSDQSVYPEGLLGINVDTPHSSYLDIKGNILSNIGYGILFCATNTTITQKIHGICEIHDNKIQADLAGMGFSNFETEAGISENVYLGIAAWALHYSTTVNGASINVHDNHLYNVQNGIYLKDWIYNYYNGDYGNRPIILSNYITLIDPLPTATYQFGIYTTWDWNGIIHSNYVEGIDNSNPSYGIASPEDANMVNGTGTDKGEIIRCNMTKNTAIGFYFDNPYHNNCDFLNNTMEGNLYGLWLNNNAMLGTQGSNASSFPFACNNRWTASTFTGHYMTATTYGSPATNSELIMENGPDINPGGSTFNISDNYSSWHDWYDYSGFGLTALNGTNNNTDNCDSLPNYKSFDSKNQISWLEKLVTDSIHFSLFSKEQHYNALIRVYRMLLMQPELIDSSKILQDFYLAEKNTNVGAIVNTGIALENGDFEQADGYMRYFIPQNRTERNYKKYYTIYDHYINDTLSKADENILYNLVTDCPRRDGLAVNKARALYSLIHKDFTIYDDNCMDTVAETYCDNTICGTLTESFDCGDNSIAGDTLYIVDYKNNLVRSISPVLTKTDGSFRFDPEELQYLDSTKLYNIASKNGFELATIESISIRDWISNSPLSLRAASVHQQWVAQYIGPDSLDDRATALDLAENIYVVGVSNDSSGQQYAVIKYDSLGVEQWVSRLDEAISGLSLYMTAITVDSDANVYIAGAARNNGNSVYGLVVAKIDSDGELLWGVIYDNFAWVNTGFPSIIGLYTDSEKNIVVGCNSIGSNSVSNPGFIVAKYDPEGDLIWALDNTILENENMSMNSMVVNSDDDILISGKVANDWGEDGNYVSVTIDSYGNLQWACIYPYGGFSNGQYEATSSVFGDGYNFFVTGFGGINRDSIVTLKFNSKKGDTAIWAKTCTIGEMGYDDLLQRSAIKILIDKDENTYVCGTGINNPKHSSFFFIKYDSTGNLQWQVEHLKYKNDSINVITSAIYGADDFIYVTGYTGYGKFTYYMTAKISVDGEIKWIIPYKGTEGYNIATCIKVSKNGNVYITGGSKIEGNEMEYTTIKYAQCPSKANLRSHSVDSKTNKTVEKNHIRAYPNPASNEFIIDYLGETKGQLLTVEFYTVYSSLIQKECTINNNKLIINTSELTSGIYYYHVRLGNTDIGSDKIVIIK